MFVKDFLTTFRACGRFIWITCYLIFFLNLYIISKHIDSKKVIYVIVTLCLIIQVVDLYPSLKNKFEYREESGYETEMESWKKILENSKNIVCMPYEDVDFAQGYKFAYVAHKNNGTINNFLFARGVDGIEATTKRHVENLKNGIVEENHVYVIKADSENLDYKEILEGKNLYCYKIENYIVVVKNEVKGLQNKKIVF